MFDFDTDIIWLDVLWSFLGQMDIFSDLKFIKYYILLHKYELQLRLHNVQVFKAWVFPQTHHWFTRLFKLKSSTLWFQIPHIITQSMLLDSNPPPSHFLVNWIISLMRLFSHLDRISGNYFWLLFLSLCIMVLLNTMYFNSLFNPCVAARWTNRLCFRFHKG